MVYKQGIYSNSEQVEKLDNNNNGLIKESIEIDDLLARIEPRLFHYIFSIISLY